MLITGLGILALNPWLEVSSEWNGNELWSSVLEVDKIAADESAVDFVFFIDLLGLCVDEKNDNIPGWLAVKGWDTDADVSDNWNEDDDDDDDNDFGNIVDDNGCTDIEDCGGSDVKEGADSEGELATAVDCTTDLALESSETGKVMSQYLITVSAIQPLNNWGLGCTAHGIRAQSLLLTLRALVWPGVNF